MSDIMIPLANIDPRQYAIDYITMTGDTEDNALITLVDSMRTKHKGIARDAMADLLASHNNANKKDKDLYQDALTVIYLQGLIAQGVSEGKDILTVKEYDDLRDEALLKAQTTVGDPLSRAIKEVTAGIPKGFWFGEEALTKFMKKHITDKGYQDKSAAVKVSYLQSLRKTHYWIDPFDDDREIFNGLVEMAQAAVMKQEENKAADEQYKTDKAAAIKAEADEKARKEARKTEAKVTQFNNGQNTIDVALAEMMGNKDANNYTIAAESNPTPHSLETGRVIFDGLNIGLDKALANVKARVEQSRKKFEEGDEAARKEVFAELRKESNVKPATNASQAAAYAAEVFLRSVQVQEAMDKGELSIAGFDYYNRTEYKKLEQAAVAHMKLCAGETVAPAPAPDATTVAPNAAPTPGATSTSALNGVTELKRRKVEEYKTVSAAEKAQVMAMQDALEAEGIKYGPRDGLYGPLMEKAIAEFKAKHKLAGDGASCDAATITAFTKVGGAKETQTIVDAGTKTTAFAQMPKEQQDQITAARKALQAIPGMSGIDPFAALNVEIPASYYAKNKPAATPTRNG